MKRVYIVVTVTVLLLLARWYFRPRVVEPTPECPHHWDFSRIMVTSQEHGLVPIKTLSGDPSQLSAPGPNTNVPEFHDCQRLVSGTGPEAIYDSLVAVFASDTMHDSLMTLPPYTVPDDRLLLPLVEVMSWGGTYEALQIRPGLSCLYVSPTVDEPPIAVMVAFEDKERECRGPRRYGVVKAMHGAQHVGIRLTQYPGMTWADYPPVARWDWDAKTSTQVIGFKCLAAWCEVGLAGESMRTPENLMDRLDPAATAALIGAMGAPELKRVLTVKGWYDEQRLAPTNATWLAGQPQARPLDLTGTLIPVASLGRSDKSSFDSNWRVVAAVLLDRISPEYQDKFNFQPMGPSGRVTTISLCQEREGSKTCPEVPESDRAQAKCGPETGSTPLILWWARTTGTDGSERYWCIVRRGHTGGDDVPGTARWRWLADDETTWARCDRGCCTSQ